jgi:L-alanine-DL-glutamate epimerase-like enolase superfamily enzyme
VTEPPEVRDGIIAIPDKPGLGITLDEAQVKRYTVG